MPVEEADGGESKSITCPSMAKLFAVAMGTEQFTPEEMAWFDQDPERYRRHDELRAAIQGFVVKDNIPQLEPFAERIDKANRKTEPPTR